MVMAWKIVPTIDAELITVHTAKAGPLQSLSKQTLVQMPEFNASAPSIT
jgi:hypothetical protein